MNCFDTAPEFIDEDNRRFRDWNPISKEQMLAKHEVLLPPDLIIGKTILDLGCCLGTTGHWCLSNGAKHYTGVELQDGYVDLANRLLGKYHPGKFTIHQAPLEKWLSQNQNSLFDIVCLLGVLYAFTDYYSILKASSSLAKEMMAFEGVHAMTKEKYNPNFCGVKFINHQPINLAAQNASVMGRGARVSPKGMDWLMDEFGFRSREGLIHPKMPPDVFNIYSLTDGNSEAARYLMRFYRVAGQAQCVSDDLQKGEGAILPWES